MGVWQILHIGLVFTIRLHWVWVCVANNVWCLNCLLAKVICFRPRWPFWHKLSLPFCPYCSAALTLMNAHVFAQGQHFIQRVLGKDTVASKHLKAFLLWAKRPKTTSFLFSYSGFKSPLSWLFSISQSPCCLLRQSKSFPTKSQEDYSSASFLQKLPEMKIFSLFFFSFPIRFYSSHAQQQLPYNYWQTTFFVFFFAFDVLPSPTSPWCLSLN